MNSSSANTMKNNFSSFVAAPVSTVANAVNNMAVSVKNGANNLRNSNVVQNIAEPIQESYRTAIENGVEPFITVPVMLVVGALIIGLILFVVFQEQILFGAEVAWIRVKNWWNGNMVPVAPSAPVTPEGPEVPIDHSAIEKSLPGRADALHLPGKKEVFNIAANRYTYQDAEPLCKAFGAELATYDQVKEAWSKGADWCNYGWVKGQAAVYPTQEDTFEKLQAGPEDQRMACGVPGVNGGYFDNPDLRFGVNCYGPRPNQNESDVRHKMGADGVVTPDGIEYNRKVQDYKAERSEIPVNPFNNTVWSA